MQEAKSDQQNVLSESSNSDQLNQARIINSQDLSQLFQSTQKNSTIKKTIDLQEQSAYDFRQRVEQMLEHTQNQFLYSTPPKTKTIDRTQTAQLFNKTKTANIKAKNKSGKLYEQICPICLVQFDEIKGKLACKHKFCFNCITQWSKTSTACPCCRVSFRYIMKIEKIGVKKQNRNSQNFLKKITQCSQEQKVTQTIIVEEKKMQFKQQDYYVCYVCGRGDNQHVLLICDGCDFYSCHIYCDPTLNDEIPEGQWFCRYCNERIKTNQEQNQNDFSMSTISLDENEQKSQQQEYQIDYARPIAARTRSHNYQNSVRALRRLRRIRE